MSEAETLAAFSTGWNAVADSTDLLVVGEMGIGNTTAGAALAAAIFGGSGADWSGRGTGLDDAGVSRKADAVDRALAKNPDAKDSGLSALTALGGREIAAMAGAMAGARARRIPVLLDGFIATSAASVLWAENKAATDHMIAAHLSAEGAHRNMLNELNMEPLVSMGLRLGEGSGAALAIPLIKAAIACHTGMATFAEAGVSDG